MESSSKGASAETYVVLQPEDGDSYWQPLPANGYTTSKLTARNWAGAVSCGIQVVAPQSFVRSHSHDRHHEIICVWSGVGIAVVAGKEHAMQPGTVIGLPPYTEHTFINDAATELKFFWLIEPHGLEDFFKAIGRPKISAQAPVPFPRPDDVLARSEEHTSEL